MPGRLLFEQSPGGVVVAATSRPGWRKPGSSPTSPTRGGSPDWLQHRPGPAWEGKAARIAALVLLVAAIPALVVAWFVWLPDRWPTPMLVLSATNYAPPVPPNAFAADDADRFATVFGANANFSIDRPENSEEELRSGDALLGYVEKFLATARPGGPDRNVVLIYLSAHGVVNDAGQPCLLLPGDNPLNAKNWLPIKDLFDVLSKQREREDLTTVLLLDAQRIDDAWSMGIVANTFSTALDQLWEESPPERCAVLVAASGLQAATALPELGGTPFGLAAARGLAGEANADKNSPITLQELTDYLRQSVDAWAWQYRRVRQTPRLYATASSAVQLVDVSGPLELKTEPSPPPIANGEFEKCLTSAAALEKSGAYARDPLGWARVQNLLERLDAESLAGKAYRIRAGETLDDLKAALAELKQGRRLPPLAPLTLAMRTRLGNPPPEEFAPWKEWANPEKQNNPEGYSYDEATAFTWSRLAQRETPLKASALDDALAFCDHVDKPAREEVAEIALLRLLQRHVDWNSGAIQAGGVPGSLLAAFKTSETLAAPGDARLHYLLKPRMAPLDLTLAKALDKVIVGDDEALDQANDRLAALLGQDAGGYERLELLSQHAHGALQTRDQALMTAIYFNRWWARGARTNLEARESAAVATLVNQTVQLARVLDSSFADTSATNVDDVDDQLRSSTNNVDAALRGLLATHAARSEAVRIALDGSPEDVLAESPELLRCLVQLVGGHSLLHKMWFERLSTKPADPDSSQQPPGEEIASGKLTPAELTYLRWLATTGVAPLLQLLDEHTYAVDRAGRTGLPGLVALDDESTPQRVEQALAVLGARIRTRLNELAEDAQQLTDQTRSAWNDQAAAQARGGMSRADLMCRSLAPLMLAAPGLGSGESPTEQLQKLDEQAWAVWLGLRAIDDCWGDGRDPASGEKPYFQRIATLAAINADQFGPGARFDRDELRRCTDRMAQVVVDWKPLVHIAELSMVDEGGGFKTQELQFRGNADMRPGEVAVYLANAQGELFPTYNERELPVRRRGVAMDEGVAGRQPVALENRLSLKEVGDLPALFARAIFRGHVLQEQFDLGRGVTVAWEEPAALEPTVNVRGEATQDTQIMFVFDCSGSMSRKAIDAVTRQLVERNRVKEGRDALKKLLNILINQTARYHVGLVVFGRRAGWVKNSVTGQQIEKRNDPTYKGPSYADVEPRFGLTPLTQNHALAMETFLQQAKALGETPLYYSVVVACDRFNAPGPRRVIVITDGVDDIVPDPGVVLGNDFTFGGAQAALKRAGAQLDIVEFGVEDTQLESRELEIFPDGREKLRELAKGTGGSWNRAKNTADLEDALLDSLALDRYRVQLEGAPKPLDPKFAEFGETTALDAPDPGSPEKYEVHLKSHDPPPAVIEVEGGEALQLTYQRPENRLIHSLYVSNDERGEQLLKNYRVAAIMPPSARDPTFHFSIQSADKLYFSRRPEVIWAKVTPRGGSEADVQPYYFMDRQFESRQPVPILQLPTRDWPGASAASIALCFAPDASKLDAGPSPFPIRGSGTKQFNFSDEATLDVNMQQLPEGQGWRIIVDERHKGEAKDYPLHLTLSTSPDSVSRTFFENVHLVHHVYRFESDPENLELRVLTRRRIEEGPGGVRAVFDRVIVGNK